MDQDVENLKALFDRLRELINDIVNAFTECAKRIIEGLRSIGLLVDIHATSHTPNFRYDLYNGRRLNFNKLPASPIQPNYNYR